jgi:membrane protein YdbS with pleckstrin-like domain
MSDSVTKMSEMCQMMMRNEMATMPYKVATGITIVVLLAIALVLLIVLEIQWIKYWSRILKRQENSPANCG